MNKLILIALVCACVCLAGCNNFTSKQTKLTDDLISYTELSVQNDTLIGVKNSQTGVIVLAPEKRDTIYAEEHFLVSECNKQLSLYKFSGEPIGSSPVEKYLAVYLQEQTQPFYKALGLGANKEIFYFLKTDEIVEAQKSFIGLKHIFLQTPTGWELRNVETKLIRKINVKNFFFIKDLKQKDETFIFAIPTEFTVKLFDLNGKELKKIPLKKWQRELKTMKKNVPIGTAVYLESPDASKL